MTDHLVKRLMEKGVSLVRENVTPVTEQMRASMRSALLRARAMGLHETGGGPLPSAHGDRCWNPASAVSPVLD